MTSLLARACGHWREQSRGRAAGSASMQRPSLREGLLRCSPPRVSPKLGPGYGASCAFAVDRKGAGGGLQPHATALNFRFACNGAATGQPGRARRLGSAVFAALRLPCAARGRGPVADPPFASLTVVEQSRRVRSRCALRARAPDPVLLGASHARRAWPGCPVAETGVVRGTSNADPVAGKAAGGAWAGRIGAAEEQRLLAARLGALRHLTRRDCPSAANAVSAAS